ncbi:MAG TPA: hypothetical protein EYP54_00470 [Anaerolineales bacterium]|nr:hypothetical protein [Anaerolineales bacterium]
MLRQEDYIVIKALHQRGVYQKDIAEELGVHPKTVSRALQRGGAPTRRRRKRGSKLDAYKARVDQLLTGLTRLSVQQRKWKRKGTPPR